MPRSNSVPAAAPLRVGILLTSALLLACSEPPVAGPGPPGNPNPVVSIFVVSGNAQTDSIGATLNGIVVGLGQTGGSEGEVPAGLKGRELGVALEQECGAPVPATIRTDDSQPLAVFGWELGTRAVACEMVVSLALDDPAAGPLVRIRSTVKAGRPIDDLIPPGTGLSAQTSLRLSPVNLTMTDRGENSVPWRIEMPDPGPILLSEVQTPSGTEYVLTALQPNGTAVAELHSNYGIEAQFDISVCQEGGFTVVKLFSATPGSPNPGCGP